MVQTDAQIRVGDKSFRVADYLLDMGWIEYPFSREDVCFLAAGEYNENYIVNVGPGYVLRINHGSQLGLEDQIGYEFNVLQSVVSSGVTPRPYRVDSQTKVMGRGTLLMQYLPGGAFQYGRDTIKAADVFARLHSLPVSSDLLVQAAPVHAIAAESLELLQRYRTPALHSEQKRLLKYHDHILNLAETSGDLFVNDPLVIVNTEVNSGNFIVDGMLFGWWTGKRPWFPAGIRISDTFLWRQRHGGKRIMSLPLRKSVSSWLHICVPAVGILT